MNSPCWNIVSVSLPVGGAALGMVAVALADRVDFASSIGNVLIAFLALGGVCLLGEAAAIVSLVRGERMPWLAVMGVIVNLVILVPALYLASRTT